MADAGRLDRRRNEICHDGHRAARRSPRPARRPGVPGRAGHPGRGRPAAEARSGSPTTGWKSRRRTTCWPADRPDRRLRAFLIDVVTGESTDVVVSLTRRAVVSARTLDPLADGQVPILDQDFALAEEIMQADPGWRAAMASRGLTDVTKIRACPLTAGRVRRRRGATRADGPGAGVRPGPRARPGLGAPGRRRRRLRGPDRAEGLQGDRRVRAAGAAGVRRLRRPGGPRPAAHHAAADRDHPAGGAELHPGRPRAALAGLVAADRLRRPRGPDPAPGQPGRRPRPVLYRASIPEMVVPVRRPEAPVLADLLRHRRVPGRQVGELARARLRLPRRDRLPGRDGHRRRRRAAHDQPTPSASTRRTSASSGSTSTSSTARPSPAASAAW